MRLYVLSDLHIEFEPFDPPKVDADVVVLAGDIDVKDKGFLWAKEAFADRPVLYVLGNHEYYRKAYPKHLEELKESSRGTNVTVMENDVAVIGNIRFLGCTLWTDFRLFGDPGIAGYVAAQAMTDYRTIRVSPSFRRLRPADTVRVHHASREWLKAQLGQDRGHRQVVVTHHAPSARSVPQDLRENLLSAAYASDLESFIEQSQVDLWIHGHLHNQSDYQIGRTRIICNPRGYPDERNEHFRPDFVVEIQ